jgi:hypothetical protein
VRYQVPDRTIDLVGAPTFYNITLEGCVHEAMIPYVIDVMASAT